MPDAPASSPSSSPTLPLKIVCLSTDEELEDVLTDELAPMLGSAVSLSFVSRENANDALVGADAVLCGGLPKELRQVAPNLRWVQFWSAGVEKNVYPELWDNGCVVANGSGIHAASCSEHILSLMLAFARGLPQSFAAQQARDWSARTTISETMFELEGKTVGIVGAGVIGQAIGKRCQAFGMKTVGTKRDASQPVPGIDVLLPHLQYHDLLLASDMIVLALPLTPSTQMLFGEEEIEILQKGTYLFNIGRGGLIDEIHLIRALQNKWIAGAGLDVFVDEPLPESSPFWSLPNCIVTPHVGGNTPAYWPRFSVLVRQQIERILSGQPIHNVVDKDLGY